jgi:predicted phage replisome organizer
MAIMGEKKYYWLKLNRNFFKRHDIRIVEEMPNGKDYVLFYLKMLLESIDHEGELRFSETIPYNEQMLSVITNTNIDIVRSAMKVFIELKMIEIFDDSTIFMNEVQKLIGSETVGAERVRKHRERKKLLQCNTNETKCNTEIEIDKEEDTDTEIDTEKDVDKENNESCNESSPSPNSKPKKVRHKYGEYSNVLLSDEDMEKLKAEFPNDYQERIERLSEYMASSGKTYKNHLATIRNWARKDKKNNGQNSGNVSKTDGSEWAGLLSGGVNL